MIHPRFEQVNIVVIQIEAWSRESVPQSGDTLEEAVWVELPSYKWDNEWNDVCSLQCMCRGETWQ